MPAGVRTTHDLICEVGFEYLKSSLVSILCLLMI